MELRLTGLCTALKRDRWLHRLLYRLARHAQSTDTAKMAVEHELWALALQVEQDHGAAAPLHIAEMIGAAATSGYEEGVAMWKAVAVRYDQLEYRAARLA